MGMHMSQDNETSRTRIDLNFNHLVFNVSPASIYIIWRSYNTFLTEFFATPQEQEQEAGQDEVVASLGEHLWATAPFLEEELWYLRPDGALDAMGGAGVAGQS